MFLFISRKFTFHLNTVSIPAIQYVGMYMHFIFLVKNMSVICYDLIFRSFQLISLIVFSINFRIIRIIFSELFFLFAFAKIKA